MCCLRLKDPVLHQVRSSSHPLFSLRSWLVAYFSFWLGPILIWESVDRCRNLSCGDWPSWFNCQTDADLYTNVSCCCCCCWLCPCGPCVSHSLSDSCVLLLACVSLWLPGRSCLMMSAMGLNNQANNCWCVVTGDPGRNSQGRQRGKVIKAKTVKGVSEISSVWWLSADNHISRTLCGLASDCISCLFCPF